MNNADLATNSISANCTVLSFEHGSMEHFECFIGTSYSLQNWYNEFVMRCDNTEYHF